GGQGDAEQGEDAGCHEQQSENRAGERARRALVRALVERGIDGYEGRQQRAFAQQVADEIRNAERRAERVGWERVVAEVVREHALAHVPQDARQEDAGRDLRRVACATAYCPSVGHRQDGRFFLVGSSSKRWTNCNSSRIPASERFTSSRSVSSASSRRSS